VVIREIARRSPSETAIVAAAGGPDHRRIDYASLAAMVDRIEQAVAAARPVGVVVRAKQVESLVAVAAACGAAGVPVALLADDARDLSGELRDWVVVDDSLAVRSSGPSRPSGYDEGPPHVVVATSGTSGPPKLVQRTWDAVLASARLAEQWHGLGWLLVYDATRWAGIQVWAQSLLTGGRLVVPAVRDPDTVARAIVDEQVAILPATPTLLRRLITSADRAALAGLKIDRITLGGEAADAQLLEQAKELFPGAKITHVYATTELGEVFRVTDGKAGFPAEWLAKPLPGGVRISMRRDGELLVQLSRDTAEVGTGDLVERKGNRFEFTGRRGDVIVVGGAKVYPKRVEELLRGVPGVADARVHGMPSAITGELVAAEIVVSDPLPEPSTADQVRAAALAVCRERLEPHAVPRVLDIVKKLVTTPAGKIPRR
jgi:acyl-CoA synthetase (AMP-forming)/AMP-acid ligase II